MESGKSEKFLKIKLAYLFYEMEIFQLSGEDDINLSS